MPLGFENQEQGHPGAATGSFHRSVPVPGHSNVRPVVVSEFGKAFPLGKLLRPGRDCLKSLDTLNKVC